MHYLIDGHNLIGRMPDIDLADPDDEIKLVLRLRSWAARRRKRRITLIFDHGLPGGADKGLSTGNVKVVFASGGQTADALLIGRIGRAKNPQEFTLVTSDNRIIREAQACRMLVVRAEEFALKLAPHEEEANGDLQDIASAADESISDSEVTMWLNLFGEQDNS